MTIYKITEPNNLLPKEIQYEICRLLSDQYCKIYSLMNQIVLFTYYLIWHHLW